MHKEFTIRGAKAGKHVLCEKPLAPTVDEIRQMIAARDRSGKMLMTAHHFRFAGTARALVEDYLAWNPVVNDGALLMAALGIEKRYRISFWDAMIVAAADRAGVKTICSEDFNDGQKFGRVRVVNPFT